MIRGLELEQVTVRVPAFNVVHDLTLHVPPGTALAITGPAGSGKSTLLATIAGDRKPDAGRVLLDRQPVTADLVGVVDQQHRLLGGLTAAENVAVRALSRRDLETGAWARIEQLLANLGLPPSAWHNLSEQLSGGQQQRVAVARALADQPALLCLDDPVSELDPTSADLVWSTLNAARDAGAVLVLATPDPAHAHRCQHVLRLPQHAVGPGRSPGHVEHE